MNSTASKIVSLVLTIGSLIAAAVGTYRIGYDQGRNDGFHQGWRECQEMKENQK